MLTKDFEYEGRQEYEREYSPPPDDILDELIDDPANLNDTHNSDDYIREKVKEVYILSPTCTCTSIIYL